jgi:hypothetical protein
MWTFSVRLAAAQVVDICRKVPIRLKRRSCRECTADSEAAREQGCLWRKIFHWFGCSKSNFAGILHCLALELRSCASDGLNPFLKEMRGVA